MECDFTEGTDRKDVVTAGAIGVTDIEGHGHPAMRCHSDVRLEEFSTAVAPRPCGQSGGNRQGAQHHQRYPCIVGRRRRRSSSRPTEGVVVAYVGEGCDGMAITGVLGRVLRCHARRISLAGGERIRFERRRRGDVGRWEVPRDQDGRIDRRFEVVVGTVVVGSVVVGTVGVLSWWALSSSVLSSALLKSDTDPQTPDPVQR